MRLSFFLIFLITDAAARRVQRRGKNIADEKDPAIYDVPAKTLNGCTCLSECNINVLVQCASEVFCKVDASCEGAKKALGFGHYDFCKFDKDVDYEELAADAKKELLLNKMQEDTTHSDFPSLLGVVTGIMGESVRVSFDAQSDVFPQKRTKVIHSVGVVAPIEWVSFGNHSYSGLFQGAEHGLIRLSAAKQPDAESLAPGAAVKIFRKGRTSANFVAMPSLDGQKCSLGNFFANDFNNHIAPPENFGLKILAAKFWQASYCPTMVGLSDFADGPAGGAVFPFRLTLRAPDGMSAVECPCDDFDKCLYNLGKLGEGTTVFDVLATENPKDDEPKKIGSIKLTGAPTTTKFGDEQLFFKHQRMEDDFAIHPDWLDQIDPKGDCAMQGISTHPPQISDGCKAPFDPPADALLEMRDDE